MFRPKKKHLEATLRQKMPIYKQNDPNNWIPFLKIFQTFPRLFFSARPKKYQNYDFNLYKIRPSSLVYHIGCILPGEDDSRVLLIRLWKFLFLSFVGIWQFLFQGVTKITLITNCNYCFLNTYCAWSKKIS